MNSEKAKVKSLSRVRLFATPWTPGSSIHGIFLGKSTGVGCHFLLQGIFPTQGWNPGLPHCRQTLCHLSHQGSPYQLSDQIRSDQSLNHVRLFATPWTLALQASLSITNSRSLLRFMSIESVMPSNHLLLCHPLLLLP